MCTLVVLAVLGMTTLAAAQITRPFTSRVARNIPGDIRLIGNTLMYCPQPGANGCTGTNNSFSNVNLTNAANPSTNIFNSTNTVLGNNVTTRNPSFANLLGIDIDVFEASGILPNGATSTTLPFITRDEQFYPGVLTLANDIF